MKIYNTMTRKKEDFSPLKEGKAAIYACGPTVYNYIHIGNARPICVFDVLRRFLAYSGYQVTYVQNFTDVDDKIIKRALEEKLPAREISENYIKEYITDSEGLNVRKADLHPKVTDNINAVINIVKTLIDKGFAYETGGDVYFRAGKFEGYGKLSNMPLEDLRAGARIEPNSGKEEAVDFALWKSAKEGEPSWVSPWGKGRPGWHIECSAMAGEYIGDTIDIHCGGQDLIFPHHENEIAQSEAATGKPLANYWMHNGYINVDNKKMSKSEGNFFTVRDIADKYGYEPIRFLMLQAHYRSPINYSLELIDSCKASLERLYNCRNSLDRAIEKAAAIDSNSRVPELNFESRKAQFIEALNDDLNTADAIAALFELTRDLNTLMLDPAATKNELSKGAETFDEMAGILGILYKRFEEKEIPREVLELAALRAQARKDKNFALADEIRGKITALGYIIEETRQGTVVKPIND
ncbi:MAG: cysteine--tRNA ligase [Oscillospiraceae bacterium]|nr:cysteine--tRNA ligase [Oscillospiraceae bacterium]